MSEGFTLERRDGRIVYANQRACEILRLSMDELLGRTTMDPLWQVIGEDGAPLEAERRPVRRAFAEGRAVENFIMGIRCPDGDVRWISTNASPISHGKVGELADEVACTFHDVTERIRAEQQLRYLTERYGLVKSAMRLGIWDWNYRSGVLEWDDAQYELFGLDPEDGDITFDRFIQRLAPGEAAAVRTELAKCFERRQDFSAEFRIVHGRTGEIRTIAGSARCFYDESGVVRLVGANWDVTSQREAERRVIHSSRMSSLGQMASGIAHEINNPLAIIQGLAFELGRLVKAAGQDPSLSPEHAARALRGGEIADKIQATVARIAKIISGLRSFSRDGDGDPFVEFDVHEVIEQTMALCREEFLAKKVDVTVASKPGAIVSGRSYQISQCLLNLLTNARDAVAGERQKSIEIELQKNAELVRIFVRDSGPGISSTVADKLMTPFFTTKPVGQGTGLGLSISKGLVESHGGAIYWEPLAPMTTFVIELPLFKSEKKPKSA